jgi:Protein of unknown function (DUF2442)
MLPVTSAENTSDRLLKCGLVPCIHLLTCERDQFCLINGDFGHRETGDDIPIADDEARDLIVIIVAACILRRSRGEKLCEPVVIRDIGEELFQRLRVIQSNGNSVKFRQALALGQHISLTQQLLPTTAECLNFDQRADARSIVRFNALSNYKIAVSFADGTTGVAHLGPRLSQGPLGDGFDPLCDEALFAKAYLGHGALTRSGGIDLAPDAMYQWDRSENQAHRPSRQRAERSRECLSARPRTASNAPRLNRWFSVPLLPRPQEGVGGTASIDEMCLYVHLTASLQQPIANTLFVQERLCAVALQQCHGGE